MNVIVTKKNLIKNSNEINTNLSIQKFYFQKFNIDNKIEKDQIKIIK
jgi:hypothetical protein